MLSPQYTVKPAHVVTSIYSQTCPCGHLNIQSNLPMWPPQYTVKPAHVVTSIKQSHIFKGHLFLVMS